MNSAEEATIRLPGFDLPLSGLLSPETHRILRQQAREGADFAEMCRFDPATTFASSEATAAFRDCFNNGYFRPLIAKHRERYRVDTEPRVLGGVPTEVFTPAEGLAKDKAHQVLINLHGGSFYLGERWGGQVESIPICALGAIKVVSVDYRMAPEHRFPAASRDVVKVYEALLDEHSPSHIGIYGCSAGAVLTAQTVALLQAEGLPAPAAVSMLGAAGAFWLEGDSGRFYTECAGMWPVVRLQDHPYFKDTQPDDPLAFPMRSAEVLGKFPPSLLIAGTRDLALSSVVHMHSCLIEVGVDADLHVWEGLGHAFHFDPELPQSRRLYDVVVRFFAKHLSEGVKSG